MISALAARKAVKASGTTKTAGVTPKKAPAEVEAASAPSASAHLASTEDVEVRLSKASNKRKRAQAEISPQKRRRPDLKVDGVSIRQTSASASEEPSANPQPNAEETIPTVTRAYSPGRLVEEESDLESRESSPEEHTIFALPSLTAGPLKSTYRQRLNYNFFPILPEDHEVFGLDPSPAVLVALESHDTIAFTGTVRIMVCRGRIDILGCPLSSSFTQHPVFGSRSYAIPIVSYLANDGVESSLELPETLRRKLTAFRTLVIFQELRTGVEGLGIICPPFESVFDGEDDLNWGLSGFHPISTESYRLQPFVLPPSWEKAMSSALQPAQDQVLDANISLVRGPKNTGKSTFARTLANRLTTVYQRVAFLECDIGQSEFTPSGMVALHVFSRPVFGPPFTHLFQPFRAHYIGSASPRSDPNLYLAAIDALIQSYKLELQYTPSGDLEPDSRRSDMVPLVVNTMGWTKGLGASLARKIEEVASPTNVFDMEQSDDSDWFSAVPSDEVSPSQDAYGTLSRKAPSRHALTPITPPSHSARYNASLLRGLSTLSYFFMTSSPASPVGAQWTTALPLCSIPPWEVDWATAFDQIIITGLSSEDVVVEEVTTALNGALVALVASEEPAARSATSDMHSVVSPYTQGALPPSPFTSNCVGLGLVRSVQRDERTCHILTTVPASSLALCRIMVKGELELPLWGFMDHRESADGRVVAGVEGPELPFLERGTGQGVGGEKRKVRRNLMRKNQAR